MARELNMPQTNKDVRSYASRNEPVRKSIENIEKPWQKKKEPQSWISRFNNKKVNGKEKPKKKMNAKLIRVDDMLSSYVTDSPRATKEASDPLHKNTSERNARSLSPIKRGTSGVAMNHQFTGRRSASPRQRLRNFFSRSPNKSRDLKKNNVSQVTTKTTSLPPEGILRLASNRDRRHDVLRKQKTVQWKSGNGLEEITVFESDKKMDDVL